MSFLQFFRILWARRALILLSVIGCVAAASLVVALARPRYQASTRIELDLLKPDPVTGLSVGGRQTGDYVKTQVELIQDYKVASRAVDVLGWENSPKMAAAYARRQPGDKRDFHRWLAQPVMDNTNVMWVSGTSILNIMYTSSTPDTAAKLADTVRDAYIDQVLATKREYARKNANWYRKQAEDTYRKLKIAVDRLTTFEKANGIILQDDASDPEMAKLKMLAQAAPAAQAAAGAFIAPSTIQVASLESQIASQAKVLGPNHPDLQTLRSQLAAAQAAVSRETAMARSGIAPGGPSASSMLSAQTQKVLAQRGKVSEAQRMAADVQILRSQYDKALGKAADYEQQAQTTESGVRVMASAVAPRAPDYPNSPLIIGGALAISFALGTLTALIIELLNRRVRSAEDLANSGLPVVGTMGRSLDDDQEGLLWKILGIRMPQFGRAAQ
ncbi:MAG: hypothetical protein KA533_02880 [Sphingobium sp.]|nr:hypothetical protein [Sphingobium sp.]MBP6112046.1 hypothetical protein [Sphingobium sp.]MBP8669819.1 hypothetical protein [Sphingobium sp.]MBP9156421.1 hypothetical protein [Sphingobium sp.]